MATISITVPDAQLTRLLDAVSAAHGWDPDSGLTKAQFVRRVVIRYLVQTVRAYEGNLAMETATANVETELGVT